MNRVPRNEPHADQLSRETLELAGSELVRLTNAQGIGIFIRTGNAWITQEHDRDDIVIGAGESFVVNRTGLVVVAPIREATVVISALPARARTCRIERVHDDGQRYPVLCARPQLAPTDGSRLAPAL